MGPSSLQINGLFLKQKQSSEAAQLLFCIELVTTFSRLTRKCKALDEASGLLLWGPRSCSSLGRFLIKASDQDAPTQRSRLTPTGPLHKGRSRSRSPPTSAGAPTLRVLEPHLGPRGGGCCAPETHSNYPDRPPLVPRRLRPVFLRPRLSPFP